jgi:hypothetical protein
MGGGTDRATYILCGQRSDELLRWLARHATVSTRSDEQGEAPPIVTLSVEDCTVLARALATAPLPALPHLAGFVALDIARLLPPLEAWIATLPVLHGVEPALFDTRRFDGAEFVSTIFRRHSGFYQLMSEGRDGTAAGRPNYTAYYDAATDRWLRGDWYGLRYLSRYLAGDTCPVSYDPETARLAVPTDWRFPEIYERALVLASGQLPSLNGRWLVYDSISTSLLDELMGKLRLHNSREHVTCA